VSIITDLCVQYTYSTLGRTGVRLSHSLGCCTHPSRTRQSCCQVRGSAESAPDERKSSLWFDIEQADCLSVRTRNVLVAAVVAPRLVRLQDRWRPRGEGRPCVLVDLERVCAATGLRVRSVASAWHPTVATVDSYVLIQQRVAAVWYLLSVRELSSFEPESTYSTLHRSRHPRERQAHPRRWRTSSGKFRSSSSKTGP
jgi:hypothetical protein